METVNNVFFSLGDKVFDIRFGWGKVVSTDYLSEYPIVVSFGVPTEERYTSDGRNSRYGKPTLSFTEYTLEGFSQERQVSEIRFSEYIGKWGIFKGKDDTKHFIGVFNQYDNEDFDYPFSSKGLSHFYSGFEPLTDEQIKILGL